MSPPEIVVRPYGPADRARVAALMIELQAYESRFTARAPADEEFATWYIDRLLRVVEESGGAMLVADDGGGPCGFAAGHAEDEPEMRDRYFYIAELVVAETHRGRSIGSRLIAALEDVARAQGLARTGIGVIVGSGRVHDLYRRLGYRDYAVKLRKTL